MIEVIEPQVADPTTSIVSELALYATRVHHLLARIDSTSRHIQTVGPSVTDRLKYEYKDASTFLDQRLLLLDRRPPMDEVFAGETFGRYTRTGSAAFGANYQARSRLAGALHSPQVPEALAGDGEQQEWQEQQTLAVQQAQQQALRAQQAGQQHQPQQLQQIQPIQIPQNTNPIPVRDITISQPPARPMSHLSL